MQMTILVLAPKAVAGGVLQVNIASARSMALTALLIMLLAEVMTLNRNCVTCMQIPVIRGMPGNGDKTPTYNCKLLEHTSTDCTHGYAVSEQMIHLTVMTAAE